MSKKIRIKESRIVNYYKPLSIEEDKEIEKAEKEDQDYALLRYKKLLLVRREKEKLCPRGPEVYHYNIFKK